MQKLLGLIIIIVLAFGCKNHSSGTNNQTDSIATVKNSTAIDTTPITSVPNETITDTGKTQPAGTTNELENSYTDSIDFNKFQVEVQENHTSLAPIDWSSYPEAKDFRTRITEAYKTNEVSFAGHYVLSTFGCGASCIMGFMVDVRDGKIYDLPLGEENSCLFAEDRVLCTSTSKLFVSGVCKQNYENKKVYYKAYLWDEDKKKFATIKAEDFLKKK